MNSVKSIDDYIDSFPEETARKLQVLRDLVRKEVPQGEETISYGVPTFKLNGKYVVYFAGYKKHISIYPIIHKDEKMKQELAPFVKGRGTLQFSLDEPLPLPLIRKVVKNLLRENQERVRKNIKK